MEEEKELFKKFIEDNAKSIKEKLKGGHLFGKPIDFDNPDEVLVAYHFFMENEIRAIKYGWLNDKICNP